ncbi:MAG: hypothetical protein U0271_42880 [Polyangiaceae bacterium]
MAIFFSGALFMLACGDDGSGGAGGSNNGGGGSSAGGSSAGGSSAGGSSAGGSSAGGSNVGGSSTGGAGGSNVGGSSTGGAGGGANTAACEAFCNTYFTNCGDSNANDYGTEPQCVDACLQYDAAELDCKVYHAGMATGPTSVHCGHANLDGGGVC